MKKFSNEDRAQDLVEYALLTALAALAVIASLATLSSTIGTIWTQITTRLAS